MAIENDSQHKPGRKPGDLVRLDAKITADLDRALNELVLATGVAKASLVRAALAQYLASHGALPPNHAELVTFAPTAGPGLASQRKDIEAAARRARESEMTEAERNASRRTEALRRIEAAPPIEGDPRTRFKAGPSEEEALIKGRERFLLERDRLVQKQPQRRARRRA